MVVPGIPTFNIYAIHDVLHQIHIILSIKCMLMTPTFTHQLYFYRCIRNHNSPQLIIVITIEL